MTLNYLVHYNQGGNLMANHFKEPLRPGVKNLDNYEIDFPEHNLEDYVMHSPKSVKQSDTNYDKEIKVDNLFIAADDHDNKMKIMAEQENKYFEQEVTDDMLPDWMKDKESMYNSDPKEWSGVDPLTGLEVKDGSFVDPEDPPMYWETKV
jgi:hypothetical protein